MKENVLSTVLSVCGVIILIVLAGGLTFLMWNWLMPNLFNLPELSFWQACGLYVFCRLLLSDYDIYIGAIHNRRRDKIKKNWKNNSNRHGIEIELMSFEKDNEENE